jgi:hypothetical protein
MLRCFKGRKLDLHSTCDAAFKTSCGANSTTIRDRYPLQYHSCHSQDGDYVLAVYDAQGGSVFRGTSAAIRRQIPYEYRVCLYNH